MRRSSWLAAAALGILYLQGLAPTVHVHDAGELTAAAWTLGLGHPPGAPLYMLVAKLFMSVVPLGHIAWRANLLSALLAVALFAVLAWWVEARGGTALAAIMVGAVAALAPTLWSQALMAEVYTLQALLLAAVLVSVDLRWRPEISALLWGLLLSCHVSLAPLTPIVLVLLVLSAGDRRHWLPTLLRVSAACVAPLVLYAYVPLRALADPAVEWGRPDSLRELWWYLSNQNVRARAFALPLGDYLARTADYAAILGRNLHLAGMVAAAGLVAARRRPAAWLSLAVIACDAAFVVLLDTAPLASEAYGIPAVVASAVLFGIGLELLGRWRPARATALVAVGAALLLSSWLAWGELQLCRSFVARDTVENVLDQAPPGAVLFTQEDNTSFPLVYLLQVEGARPDLEIYDRDGNLFASPYDRPLFRVGDALARFRQSHEEALVSALVAAGREVVYATPFLDFEPRQWRLEASGTVGRVRRGDAGPLPEVDPPLPRSPQAPAWMSRQILAMDQVRRAAAEIAAGAPLAARARLAEAAELAEIAELELRIAQLLLSADAPELAQSSALRALERRPSLAAAASLAAHAALLAGRLDEAESLAVRANTLDPSLPHGHLTLGLAAIRRERWRDAEQFLSRALELGIGGSETLVNRALVRERLGELDLALADATAAIGRQAPCAAHRLRLRLLVRSGADRNELGSAVCELVSCQAPSQLAADELTELLLAAAQVGAPPCVDEWLQPLLTEDNDAAQVARAYLRALDRSRQQNGRGAP